MSVYFLLNSSILKIFQLVACRLNDTVFAALDHYVEDLRDVDETNRTDADECGRQLLPKKVQRAL